MRVTALVFAILAASRMTAVAGAASAAPTIPTCMVALAPIAFGRVTRPGTSIPVTITVGCSAGAAYTVKLLQDGGCRDMRSMDSDGNVLTYRIMVPNSGRTWCDGTGATGVFSGTGTGLPQTFFTTAVILDDTGRKHAGTYADRINGTIEVTLP